MKHFLLTLSIGIWMLAACANPNSRPKQSPPAETKSSDSNAAVAAKSYEKLDKAQFIEKVWDYTKSPDEWKYKGNKPAIIDFYADWCGPCRIASPILEEVGSEYAGKIQVYKINTDEERELAQVFQITGIPAFLYIPADGKPVMMAGIGRSKEDTKKMFIDNIEKYLLVKK
ncbi:MAG: thioredoxin family protein [Bacteroidales bacterium]